MQILLSDEEREFIEIKLFGYEIKDGCPKDVEKSIKRKMDKLDKYCKNVISGELKWK